MKLAFSTDPNLALVLAVTGVLLLYCELIWAGKVLPGILGALLTVSGTYWLVKMGPTVPGVCLICGAAVCLAVEVRYETFFLAAAAGVLLLAAGLWKLYGRQPIVLPQTAISVSIVFGTITTGLLRIARRAHDNKRNILL